MAKRKSNTNTNNNTEDTNMSATETKSVSGLDDLLEATEFISLADLPKRTRVGGGGGSRGSKWQTWLNTFLESGNEVGVITFNADAEKGDGTRSLGAVTGGINQAVKAYKSEHDTTESPIRSQVDNASGRVFVVNKAVESAAAAE